MQSAALAALGIEGEYTAHAVAPDELGQFVEHAPSKGFRGVNVTKCDQIESWRLIIRRPAQA